MEYQNITNFNNNQTSKFRAEIMMHVEHIIPIIKLNLRLQCLSRVYVVIVIHTYLVL